MITEFNDHSVTLRNREVINMKRRIVASTATDDAFKDLIDNLKADFDYIVEGLDKLSRSGNSAISESISIGQSLQSNLDDFIAQIADKVGK